MSADNYAVCPACADRWRQEIETLHQQVKDAYGVLPVEEFDSLRASLVEMQNRPSPKPTFREYYEFYGASEGIIGVSYSGSCDFCGLTAEFNHEQKFWP